MAFVGEFFGFSRPDAPETPPVPETPDITEIKDRNRRRLANTGIQSRIFTSPLGVGNQSGGKRNLLGE